jgi:hypothetical protein
MLLRAGLGLFAISVTFALTVWFAAPAEAGPKGCQPSCADVEGKCSCVSIEGYKCCGSVTGELTADSGDGSQIEGCQPTCADIPKGQCSCVSIEGFTCCGRRSDSLTAPSAAGRGAAGSGAIRAPAEVETVPAAEPSQVQQGR